MSALRMTLARMPLFRGLNERELNLLETILRPRHLAYGEVLFTEGDSARSCYVVVTGEINVLKRMHGGADEHLATLKAGALVGHVALIDARPRSATCIAAGRVLIMELSGDDFDRLFSANNPFAFKILDHITTDLVMRLRLATKRLTEAAGAGTEEKKRISVREAAEALLAGKSADFDGVDLDEISFTPGQVRKDDYRR